MPTVTIVLAVLAVAALMAGRLHVLLHMLQQEHYENARLFRWVTQEPRRLDLRTAFVVLIAGAVVAWLAEQSDVAGLVGAVVALAAATAWAVRTWRRDQVKPLAFTPRAKRLYAVGLVLTAAAPVAGGAVGGDPDGALAVAVLAAVAFAAAPWLLGLANLLLRPYQRMENERYVRSARRRLADVAPLVVGISGSFGKTTTKACVAAAIDPVARAYPTPASFNSFLGIVRAINEGLAPEHEAFIAELGAYRIGDIAELCALVSPTIGVLASLGPAHLERFGSMDAIELAEGEVADALPADGLFVTRADDERCARVARDRAKCAVTLVSPAPHPDADLWAQDIEISSGGTEFLLCRRGGAEPVTIKTRLLGAHNVANLLMAAAVALHVGVTEPQLARALRRVAPPKHRLDPIVNAAAGIVVIDDSYNANPIGAAAALDVLGAHEAGRRILVTPGMVELGAEEEVENRRLGELAAAVCDLCILTGPYASIIREGLLDSGFAEDQIIMAPDGPSAQAAVARLTRRGDVVLFENDLPDVYV